MSKFLKTRLNAKNPGESLAEVLVAVGIIVMVLASALVLVNRGISTNISVKNKIIAINISREGIEGIRNIRDTNWLKYSGDRRSKWLKGIGAIGMYTVDFDDTSQRFLAGENTAQTTELDLESGTTGFSDYRLFKNSYSRYTHDNSGSNAGTIFYRQIKLTPEPEPYCGSTPCGIITRLHVISRVQWGEDLLVGTIVMEAYLYDYFNRYDF